MEQMLTTDWLYSTTKYHSGRIYKERLDVNINNKWLLYLRPELYVFGLSGHFYLPVLLPLTPLLVYCAKTSVSVYFQVNLSPKREQCCPRGFLSSAHATRCLSPSPCCGCVSKNSTYSTYFQKHDCCKVSRAAFKSSHVRTLVILVYQYV